MSESKWNPRTAIPDAEAQSMEAKGEFNEIYRKLAILGTIKDIIHSVWEAGSNVMGSSRSITEINKVINCTSLYGHTISITFKICGDDRTMDISINGEYCQHIVRACTTTKGGNYLQQVIQGTIVSYFTL